MITKLISHYLTEIMQSSLLKNAYYLMVGTGINSILGFTFLLIAANLFEVDAVGQSSAALSFLGLLALISELGVGIALIRFLPSAGSRSRNLINTAFTLCSASSIIFGVIVIIGMLIWIPELSKIFNNILFIAIFLSFAIALTLQPVISNIFIAKRATQFVLLINVIASLSKIVCLIFLYYLYHGNLSIFISVGLATTLVVILSLFIFIPKVEKNYVFSPQIDKICIKK